MNGSCSDINNCPVIELPKIHNPAGNITIVHNNGSLVPDIKRVYYLYDVPGGSVRGGHAHKFLNQIIIAASGSFDILLDDGLHKKIVQLNRPNYGLIVVPGIWREIANFSSGAICLVLASEKYDAEDYLRNYSDFLEWKSLR